MENSVDHENIFTTLHQMPLYMFCWKIQIIQMSICFDCEFLCPGLQKNANLSCINLEFMK